MAFIWHDEAEEFIFRALFQEAGGVWAIPVNYYLGLCNQVLAEASNLATINTELAGLGYARAPIPSSAVGWPTIAADGDYMKCTSEVVTFTSVGGAWAAVTRAFLATTVDGAGKLLASWDLASYALPSGESMDITVALRNK
jgi:hypothetical protein